MKLRYRRLIYLSFFAVFFVATPVLIMYASGYRYSLKKNLVEKTGILYLESKPKDAQIFINGKYLDKTPARFTAMLPDKYAVEVRKDGYHSWNKDIEIYSNLSTFYKNIILFKQALPISLIEGEVNLFQASPDGSRILYSIRNESSEDIKLINTKTDASFSVNKILLKNFSKIEFVEWASSGNKVLIKQLVGDFNKYLIIDLDNLETKELFDITRTEFEKISWDRNNDNYLYGLRQSVLYRIDLINKQAEIIIPESVSDYQALGNNIYYVSNRPDGSYLKKRTLENGRLGQEKIIKLPRQSDFGIKISNQRLFLLDQKSDDLFVIDINLFEQDNLADYLILQEKAKSFDLSPDESRLLFNNDFEIFSYDFLKKEKMILNRFSNPLETLAWHPAGHYLFFLTSQELHAMEIDSLSQKNNDVVLAKLEIIRNFAADGLGKKIYLLGKNGNQQGIFVLEIQ